jgi:chromosome condensin MukBEF MukE localization factor
MAIGKKNSGKFQQDAVVGRFMADARKPQELNQAVRNALAQGERNRIYREAQEAKARLNPRFVR